MLAGLSRLKSGNVGVLSIAFKLLSNVAAIKMNPWPICPVVKLLPIQVSA